MPLNLFLYASLAISHTASAQKIDLFESVAWGVRFDAGPESVYICDLTTDSNWSGTITSHGMPPGEMDAFTNSGLIEYAIDPTGAHIFNASFVGSGQPNDLVVSFACQAMRMTIQVVANEPFIFESAAHSIISPNAIIAAPGVGVMINTRYQDWIIRNRCNLESGAYVNPWDADVSVIILGERVDQVGDEPLESRLEPGVEPDPSSPTRILSGLGTTTGTLPEGTYTFYLYSAADSSNTLPVDVSGAISLRLSPISSTCPADVNDDGILDSLDINTFIKLQLDFNTDGQFNFFDISAFISAFSAGCDL